MAKNNDKPKKDINDLSEADLKNRRKNVNTKIDQAVENGNGGRAGRLENKKNNLTAEIIERKAGVDTQHFQSKEDVMEYIKNDPRYKLLSPEQQKALEVMNENYAYSDMDASTLTAQELKAVTNYAARIMDPYYDRKRKDINQNYEIGLSDKIADLKTGLDRYQTTLDDALANNDQAMIETTTQKINQINQALPFYQSSLNEFVTFKRNYLEEQIKGKNSEIEQGLGRADEDFLLSTRQQERNATKKLKDLEQTMRNKGYAWSEERTDDEKVLGDENTDILTSITNTKERTKMDLVRAAEDAFGTDAVNQVQGASNYVRGGVTGLNTMATNYDIQDALDTYQQNVSKEISSAEGILGTAKLKEIYGDNYNQYLTGNIEGSANSINRTNNQLAMSTYQTGLEDAFTGAARSYGTRAITKGIGANSGIGAVGAYGGVTLPTGQGYKVGSEGRLRNQDLRTNRYNRKDATQQYVDQQKLARQSAYQQ